MLINKLGEQRLQFNKPRLEILATLRAQTGLIGSTNWFFFISLVSQNKNPFRDLDPILHYKLF